MLLVYVFGAIVCQWRLLETVQQASTPPLVATRGCCLWPWWVQRPCICHVRNIDRVANCGIVVINGIKMLELSMHEDDIMTAASF